MKARPAPLAVAYLVEQLFSRVPEAGLPAFHIPLDLIDHILMRQCDRCSDTAYISEPGWGFRELHTRFSVHRDAPQRQVDDRGT